MKDDFQHLEDDMTNLGERMEEITLSSNSINAALEERKKEISKLCGVHHLLKKVRHCILVIRVWLKVCDLEIIEVFELKCPLINAHHVN